MRLRSLRTVTPGGVRPADVVVEDGRIVDVSDPAGDADHDFGNLALMPGAVDVHVHINEPGRTEWEGFETATRAAAAGGTTMLVDMPLNSIPSTTTVDALHHKVAASEGKLSVDVGFWGGLVPGNIDQLEPLWDAGVLGFKCFMVDSGVEEFGWVRREDLEAAMPVLARLGSPLLAHAEIFPRDPRTASPPEVSEYSPMSYDFWLSSRPDAAETAAIELLTQIAKPHRARVHIVHLATEQALPLLRELRKELPVTVETCAHYLTFAAEEIEDGGTAFKCAPPIRTAATREALWKALADGDLDFVTTDHSPSPWDLKSSGRFDQSWGGIPSIQLLLSAVWTGANQRGHSLRQLAQWVCERPAAFAGLGERKGKIAPGYDADLVVFDPDSAFVVERANMHHRHKYTPYEGRELLGIVRKTFVRGQRVFDDGAFGPPTGLPLLRPTP